MSDDNWGPSLFREGGFMKDVPSKKIIAYKVGMRFAGLYTSTVVKTTSKGGAIKKVKKKLKAELKQRVRDMMKHDGEFEVEADYITEDKLR